jgi:hypothetical protein
LEYPISSSAEITCCDPCLHLPDVLMTRAMRFIPGVGAPLERGSSPGR